MKQKYRLKDYYRKEMRRSGLPFSLRTFLRRNRLPVDENHSGEWFFSLTFNLCLIASILIVFIGNAGTVSSLGRMDPDNKKSIYIQKKVAKGWESVRAYFRPAPIPPPIQGGEQ